MSELAAFLEEHQERVFGEYVELVYQRVERYGRSHPETFPANTRRLIDLLPLAAQDAAAPPIADFVNGLVEERLTAGFHLVDVLVAMFLYDDVVLPLVWEAVPDAETQRRVVQQLHAAVQAVAVHFARAFVEQQLRLVERQRQAVLELSTPVIKVWDGILTLPLIGTVDSHRARQIMEELLHSVAMQQASVVILDITGVPVVDTNVADHLIKTIRAAELLGAECLLVGIGSELSQTLVGLGIDLRDITTAADLQRGLALAFDRLGLKVVPTP
ncbi:MAG: STAS domain-containing protein [Armatimonadetes bacterium]|nr:STAS domain-containing protein [Armatimonadota bacterium]